MTLKAISNIVLSMGNTRQLEGDAEPNAQISIKNLSINGFSNAFEAVTDSGGHFNVPLSGVKNGDWVSIRVIKDADNNERVVRLAPEHDRTPPFFNVDKVDIRRGPNRLTIKAPSGTTEPFAKVKVVVYVSGIVARTPQLNPLPPYEFRAGQTNPRWFDLEVVKSGARNFEAMENGEALDVLLRIERLLETDSIRTLPDGYSPQSVRERAFELVGRPIGAFVPERAVELSADVTGAFEGSLPVPDRRSLDVHVSVSQDVQHGLGPSQALATPMQPIKYFVAE